jgi:hypothetical protein
VIEALEDRCLPSSPGSLLTTGPLVEVSNPDPLASCPPGPEGANVAAEPMIAVNPTNPNNIVAAWIAHGRAGNAVGVTFDGGKSWQNVPLSGMTQCMGGTEPDADPWLSFAPNGTLYSIGVNGGKMLVNRSTDGGLTWSSPIQVNTSVDNHSVLDDKPSITADPGNPSYVYATWARFKEFPNGNGAETMFARSTDGGQTWQPEQDIHDAPGTDFNWGNQIVVLPDGTLIDAFTEGGTNGNNQMTLTLLRSTDHGQTWSAPIAAVVQQPLLAHVQPPNALVTDPDTGQLVEAHPMFDSLAVDPHTGNLYAVWIDGRFSSFQYNSIALSMSSDGGLTWSQPIQVNQTPNSVPAIDRQAWNPTVAVSANGTVAVSYYDFRNNTPAAGALTDYWMAYAPALTATSPSSWSEVRLTDTSFNLEQAPPRFAGAFYLGDYEGLAAAGNDFVSVWGMPDGTASSQESIFFRRISDPPAATPSLAANPGTFAAPTQTQLAAATRMPSSASPPIAGWLAQAPLLPPSLTSNLVPAGPAGSVQPGSLAEAASDHVFASFDSGMFLAGLVDELAQSGGSFDDLTPASRRK